MVLCDTVATKSHNHSSVIASYTANVEHCCRVGAGSTGTAILSLAGTGLGYPGFHTGELRYFNSYSAGNTALYCAAVGSCFLGIFKNAVTTVYH